MHYVGSINQLTTTDSTRYWNGTPVLDIGSNGSIQIYGGEINTNMDQLMNVIVITTDKEIILDKKTVAKTEEEAKYNVDLYHLLKTSGIAFDDVTVIVQKHGIVKVKKEEK